MEIIYKNIDELIPYENNPRINDEAVEYVKNSIKEFEKGIDVVCIIDDDMNGIYYFENENGKAYNKKIVNQDEFVQFLEKYSVMCEELGFKLWGVNLNQDALSYRQYSPFSTNSVILGPFSCHLRNNIRYDVNFL